jgi:trans-2,3-dihydro-3-hydroxyanthranilate isomerase
VEVRIDGDRAHASMLQGPVTFGPELDPAMVMGAAGLDARDADPGLPPQLGTTGLWTLIAPVADADALRRVAPVFETLSALHEFELPPTLYVVWCDPKAGRARARMFTPMAIGGEDPATGSAAGPLCAYLHARTGCARVEIEQGAEMGRPSLLEAEIEGDRVRVGGGVVTIVDGTVTL